MREEFTPRAALLLDAMQFKQRYQLSYLDAAVIAAAKQLGTSKLYSEDLNDGQDYDGVQVVNRFRN